MRTRKQKICESGWETGTAGCKTYQNNNPHCYYRFYFAAVVPPLGVASRVMPKRDAALKGGATKPTNYIDTGCGF